MKASSRLVVAQQARVHQPGARASATMASPVSRSIAVSRNSCCGTGWAQSSPLDLEHDRGRGLVLRRLAHPHRQRVGTDARLEGTDRGRDAGLQRRHAIGGADQAGEARNPVVHRGRGGERRRVEILQRGEIGGVEQPGEIAQHCLAELLPAQRLLLERLPLGVGGDVGQPVEQRGLQPLAGVQVSHRLRSRREGRIRCAVRPSARTRPRRSRACAARGRETTTRAPPTRCAAPAPTPRPRRVRNPDSGWG